MVKVIVQMYPVIPSESEEERIELRPIGRNAERYQETLRGWCDIVEEGRPHGGVGGDRDRASLPFRGL